MKMHFQFFVALSLLFLGFTAVSYPESKSKTDLQGSSWRLFYKYSKRQTRTIEKYYNDTFIYQFISNKKYNVLYQKDTLFGLYKWDGKNSVKYFYLPIDTKLDKLYGVLPSKTIKEGTKLMKHNTPIIDRIDASDTSYPLFNLMHHARLKISNDTLTIKTDFIKIMLVKQK